MSLDDRQPPTPRRRGMQPSDLLRLGAVSDPQVSPDGSLVAWTQIAPRPDGMGRVTDLWVAATDGSSVRRLTSGGRDHSPRWSPDARRLAFVSGRQGGYRLMLIRVDGGEAVTVADRPGGCTAPCWSPDGRRLGFLSREEGSDPGDDEHTPRRLRHLNDRTKLTGWTDRWHHIYIAEAEEDGATVQLTAGPYDDGEPTWSPDGRRIAFTSCRGDDRDISLASDLYVVDTDGGDLTRVTDGTGRYQAPAWAPVGNRLACRAIADSLTLPRHTQIAVHDLDTGSYRVLTEGTDLNFRSSYSSRPPVWDGETLLTLMEDRGRTHLVRLRGDDEPVTTVVGGEVLVADADAAGGVIVHLASTADRPGELFCGDLQLTDVGSALGDGVELCTTEHFTATTADGQEIDAWLMRPPGFDLSRTYPLLLTVHGGPYHQYQVGFAEEFQINAAAGNVVLYCNPRGSSGRSEEWGRAIRGPYSGGPGFGTVDYDDLMRVVDEALRRFPFVDAGRMGLLGGSYGGFMTAWIIGHTDRFRAGCAEAGIYNWLSILGTGDEPQSWPAYLGALPYSDPDPLMRLSALTHVERMAATPLLLIHAEDDSRTPMEQAEQLFAALRLSGGEVELLRFPHGGHGLQAAPPVARVRRFEAVLEWFGRHLAGGDEEPSSQDQPVCVHAPVT